jgi:hypothetical protein
VALTRVLARVEAIFPDLVRLRIVDWSPDMPVYVMRKSLPPDVDSHLLERGYLYVYADLDALTPVDLVLSLTDWDWRPKTDSSR